MKIKFATPYLVSTTCYINLLNTQTVRPVYVTDKTDGKYVAIAMYDDDLIEEINTYAWLHEDELIAYSNELRDKLQDELNEELEELEY